MSFVHFCYLQGAGMLYVHINSNGAAPHSQETRP